MAEPTNTDMPTVVLVHGAFADGSSWEKVIPLLQAKGLRVVAVQNPLTSLADDVAAALAEVAVAPPANAILELAGPESLPMATFVGKALAASGDTRTVVADPQARYFGAALDARGLTADGANPRIGPTRFEAWLNRSAARV